MTRLRAGSAAYDVTPERPVPMSGYGARTGRSTGVHEPLSAKALVLSDGASAVGIVSVDLLNVSRQLVAGVRSRLAEAGADIDEFLLAATHTHGGPYVPADAIEVHPGLAVDADVSDVVERIERGVAESLVTARERLEPATISVGRASNAETPINRRAVDERGRIPTGEVDPELLVVDVETAAGDEAVIVNFAMHPVCLSPSDTELSPDWPAVVYERLAAERDGATVLFLNGAAADVNPRGRMDESRSGDQAYAYLEEVGDEIADTASEALAAADDGESIEHAPVVAESRKLRLPVKRLGDPELLRRRIAHLDDEIERLERQGNDEALARVRVDRRYAEGLLELAEWDVRELPAMVTYVAAGPVGFLGLPGEFFVEHGRAFKERATADPLVVTGYANGYVGYVPTLAELENFGYEVWSTKIAPEAIGTLRDAAMELVEPE